MNGEQVSDLVKIISENIILIAVCGYAAKWVIARIQENTNRISSIETKLASMSSEYITKNDFRDFRTELKSEFDAIEKKLDRLSNGWRSNNNKRN